MGAMFLPLVRNSDGAQLKVERVSSLATVVDAMRVAIIAAVGHATNELPRLPINAKRV